MGSMKEERAETRRKSGTPPPPGNANAADAPSGFILKLFQMVNGAPDEVIAWTGSGDAFIIGSDLKRLESETLPQYFRHNRFQSLVRQLNFYSFRKINRERNVWIYKHHLFHRDRPEDLYMVRRRTCPGLDGRKQRFSRFSARKLNQTEAEDNSISDGETSSLEEDSTVVKDENVDGNAKRALSSIDSMDGSSSKRQRRLWNGTQVVVEKSSPELLVDTSMLKEEPEEAVTEMPEEENSQVFSQKDRRIEMAEQSMVVAQVAMKLEQYAKKAMKGRGRTRRGGTGVVTPPFGLAHTMSSTNLITYDDENWYDHEDQGYSARGASNIGVVGVVTDGDDSTASEDNSLPVNRVATVTPEKKSYFLSPVINKSEAMVVTDRIVNAVCDGQDISPGFASVVAFCMSTSPEGGNDLAGKILQLIGSCSRLAAEFQLYSAALRPITHGGVSAIAVSESERNTQSLSMQQMWAREGSRLEAVHAFKIFAVNCVHKYLGKASASKCDVDERDWTLLHQTADAWQKSVGLFV